MQFNLKLQNDFKTTSEGSGLWLNGLGGLWRRLITIQYIRDFTYDGTICFTYEAGDITIKNTSHWHREKISLPWHMRFKTKAKRLSF